jgi:hypothetical protein
VAAALGSALRGVAPFRIRHGSSLSVASPKPHTGGKDALNLISVLALELTGEIR